MKIQLPKKATSLMNEASTKLLGFSAANDSNTSLEQINNSFVLFDDYLINTENGEFRQIKDSEPSTVAEAISALVSTEDGIPNILLLLPPVAFISSSYRLTINNEKMLYSALQLQAHTIVPAFEGDLLLVVDASSSAGIAFWYPVNKANAFFDAFSLKGMFLAAIMPRTHVLKSFREKNETVLIRDEDSDNCAQVVLNKGRVTSSLCTNRLDLEQSHFKKQWQIETDKKTATIVNEFNSLESWIELKQKIIALPAYCFIPAGAKKQINKIKYHRKVKFFSSITLVALLVLCMPFIINWLSIIGLENELEEQQGLAVEARSLQSSIFIMEDEWGAIIEYPDLQVASVLLRLNEIEVIRNGLTSVSIDEGIIDIAGTADDPAYLVELLVEYEEFYNITQSRSISGGRNVAAGNRFGLRMNLSGVDFEAYEDKYPIEE